MDEFKILKTIKENNDEIVCVVEYGATEAILKKINSNNIDLINMLKNEVNVLYKLRNEDFVPKILSYKFEEGNNYIITELINGEKLNKIKKLDLKNNVLLMIKILEAVEKLHSFGIVHCDLKPENILVGFDKTIKLIDFGISVYDNNNYFPNYVSVSYCSVEQILKKNITYNTDLFALGVIFYIILFRKKPFNGTVKEIQRKKIKCEFDKCNNDLLDFIFLKLFAVYNEARYKNITEFKNDLYLLYNLFNR